MLPRAAGTARHTHRPSLAYRAGCIGAGARRPKPMVRRPPAAPSRSSSGIPPPPPLPPPGVLNGERRPTRRAAALAAARSSALMAAADDDDEDFVPSNQQCTCGLLCSILVLHGYDANVFICFMSF